jgi:nitric oxide reductase NorE protein
LGLVILGFMAWRSWHGYYQAEKLPNFESGVLYWHMVDLVWVMLFPTVYLMG